MKKNVFGRQFKRDANERKALFKNLLTSLVVNEKIQTTEAKAKAIKSAADKLITKAKTGGQNAMRLIEADVNHDAAVKLIADLGVRFATRPGGYTRIIKIGHRVADNAPMAVIEWVEKKAESKELSAKGEKKAASTVAKKETKKAAPKKVETKKAEAKKEKKVKK